MTDIVELICIKVKSKLRVRITSDGYLKHANVQFPRDLRVENRLFKVDKSFVKLVLTRGRWFYSVKNKNNIEIVGDNAEHKKIDLTNMKIFEDTDTSECSICLTYDKDTIFNPCGHYYCCTQCSNMLVNCPICMTKIEAKINKALVD